VKKFYPLFIDISQKHCTVVGGGSIAARKTKDLISYGAKIRLISKEICDELKHYAENKTIEWVSENYKEGQINGSFLVIAATNNNKVNKQIYEEAKQKGIMVNVIDSPELCSFIVPSRVVQGDLNIAISTNGKSPLLSKKIRQELESYYGPEYAEFIDIIGNIKTRSLTEISSEYFRRELLNDVFSLNWLEKIKASNSSSLKAEIEILFKKYKDKDC
jgi:precorrin-2 dehydrogenase/sirohydrochlorin ferrochelatase